MSAEALGPLGSSQVFARGWRLWLRNFAQLAIGTLAVYVPMQALNLVVAYLTQPGLVDQLETYPKLLDWMQQLGTNPSAPPPPGLTEAPQGAEYSLMLLGQVLSIAIAVFGTALFLSLAVEIALASAAGRAIGWREALDAAVGRLRAMALITLLWGGAVSLAMLPGALVAGIVAGIAVAVGGIGALVIAIPLALLATLALPVWLAVIWSVPVPVLISEGARNFAALGRSYQLVKGRFWATSGALALMALVQLAIALVLFAPAAVSLFSGGPIVLSIVLLVTAGVLSSAILYPLLGTVIASIYLDLRSREGLSPGPGSPPAPAPAPDPERRAGKA